MRVSAIALALLLSFSCVPAVSAQTAASPEGVAKITDPGNDVKLRIAPNAGGPSQDGGENYAHIDILEVLFGEETASEFKITLKLKALTPSSNAPGQFRRSVEFTYGLQGWRVMQGFCGRGGGGMGGGGGTSGCLQYFDGGALAYRTAKTLQYESKADSNSIVFTIPKSDIYNQNRVPSRYGDQLGNITANTFHSVAQTGFLFTGDVVGGVSAIDATTPDPTVKFTFSKGSRNFGVVALSSPDPIRVSNGEATTIVYKVNVQNLDSRARSIQLQVTGLPPEWSARVPSLVQVQAKSNLSVPVIVSVPFTHDHGKTFTFKVSATVVGDEKSHSDLDLGVFWTDVPQPSAHHQGRQWFHSAPSDNPQLPDEAEFVIPTKRVWMNGIEKDPDPTADDANIPSNYNQGFFPGGGGGGGRNVASWFFPLSPGLLIGLDFDVSRPNKAIFDIIPDMPATDAQVRVQLHYCDPDPQPQQPGQGGGGGGGNQQGCHAGRPIIAAGLHPTSLNANTKAHFEITMITQPQYDLIPFKHGANVGLSIQLTSNVPQNAFGTEPRPEFVTKDAALELALFEYHDPVDQAFQAVGELQLEALGAMEKLANPGRTAVYKFTLASSSAEQGAPVKLELQGVNRGWAKILGATEFELAPQEKREIVVAVEVPAEAGAEERADLFLVAENQEDPSIVTAVRFRATVATGQDIPDEAASATVAATGKKGVPGFESAVLVLAGLVLLLLGRRRR